MFRQKKSKRLKKNLKLLRNKRVDYPKYVKDFYLENGLAYISCNVKSYEDVISPYSVPDYEWPNEAFTSFVEQNAHYIPVEYPIVLEISGTHFTEDQQRRITEAIGDYYRLQMGDKQLEIDASRQKVIILLLLGVLLFGGVFLLEMVHALDSVYEIVLVLFWFFVWESADILFFDRRDLEEDKTDAAQLASMKIIFSDRFEDGFENPEEEKEFIHEVYSEFDSVNGDAEEEPNLND